MLYTRDGYVLHEQLVGQSNGCFADMSDSQFAKQAWSDLVGQSVGVQHEQIVKYWCVCVCMCGVQCSIIMCMLL